MVKSFSKCSKKSGECSKKMSEFWKIVDKISGNDSAEFLKHILQHTHKGKNVLNQIELKRVNDIIASTKTLHERADHKKKHEIICALSRSGFTKEFLVSKGLKIGNQQYATARKKFDIAYEEKVVKSADCLTNCQKRTPQPDLRFEVYPNVPEVEQTLSLKRKQPYSGLCICGKQWNEVDSQTVGCDECNTWFHFICLGLDDKDLPEGDWFCERCKDKKKRKITREVNLSPEKIQLWDTVEEYSSPIKLSPEKEFQFSPIKDIEVDFVSLPQYSSQKTRRPSTSQFLSKSLNIFDEEEKDDENELLENPFEIKTNLKKKNKNKAKKESTKKKQKKKNQPIGLIRHDNSCFVISIIQCFLNISTWRSQLLKNVSNFNSGILDAIANLAQQAEYSSETNLDPEDFNLISNVEYETSFSRYVQDDALAFFLQIIKQSQVLQQECGFYTETKITCTEHSNCINYPIYSAPEEFNSLALTPYSNCSIQTLVNEYFQEEIIEAKCYQTEGNPLVTSTSCVILGSFPEILVIQLKRFNNQRKKNKSDVSVSFDLQVSSGKYNLTSVVVHKGTSIDSGHYICYSTFKGSNQWYQINDQSVTVVSKDIVKAEANKKGYIFFYSYEMKDDLDTPLEPEKVENETFEDKTFEEEETEFLLPSQPEKVQSNGLIDLFHYTDEINTENLIDDKTGKIDPKYGAGSLMHSSDRNKLEQRVMQLPFFSFYTLHDLVPTTQNSETLKQKFEETLTGVDINSNFFNKGILEIKENYFFSCKSITRLFSPKWYSDVILSSFLDLLCQRYSCRSLDSDFAKQLNTRTKLGYSYDKLLKTIRFEEYINEIKSQYVNYLFIPIHLPGHWIIGVLSEKDGFRIFDSLNNDQVLQNEQIQSLSVLFKQYDIETYFQYNPYNVVQQVDDYNCGVYCLLYAHSLLENHSLDQIFSFSKNNVETYRIFVALVLEKAHDLAERLSETINSYNLESSSEDNDHSYSSSDDGGGDYLFDSATDLMENYKENINSTKEVSKKNYPGKQNKRLNIKQTSKIKKTKKIVVYRCEFNHKYIPNKPCGYETSDRSNMKRHLNTHFGKNPFICHHCNKGFAQNQTLKIHLESCHKEKKIQHQPNSKVGGKSIDIQIQKHINAWLTENSIQSSQTIEIDGKKRQIFNIPFSWSYMHKKYLEEESSFKISKGTFLKYKLGCFKRSKKRTDLCEDCSKEVYFKKDLAKFIKEGDKKAAEEIQAKLNILQVHKLRARHQREEFKKTIQNLKQGECVILLDFKENIKLGGNKNEIGQMFYNKQQRSVLGFIVYYKVGNEIKQQKIVFISEILSKDGFFVVKAMKALLDSSTFKRLNLLNLHFWSDGGPHFKCFEVLHFLRTLKKNKKFPFKKVQSSFFIEHHGKNPVDSLFGQITSVLNEYEKANEEILTTEQLIKVLQENLLRTCSFSELNIKVWKLKTYKRDKFIKLAKLIPGRATVRNSEDQEHKNESKKKKKKKKIVKEKEPHQKN